MRRRPDAALLLQYAALGLTLSLALPRPGGAQSAGSPAARPAPLPAFHQLGRDVLRELIETNTTQSSGSTTVAAERMAARFRAAGFPAADVQVLGAGPKSGNLLVRYRGSGGGARKPVLLLAHLDVVEAKREDWTVDPFVLTEKDGFFYGRGTLDIKGGAAALVASLLRLKQEGFQPDRDLVLALTAGEETGVENGVQWLLANHRDLIDAEYCLNVDAGGGEIVNGKRTAMDVQAAEKVYLSFTLTVRNAGGHSSMPTRDNAIYRLAAGLERLSRYEFPTRLNDITREYFSRMAAITTGPQGLDMRTVAKEPRADAAVRRLSASPLYNALMRTTCVATQLEGGHAENALPQTARAVVNCRMLPDEDPRAVQRTLARVVADTAIAIDTVGAPVPSPASPLTPELLRDIERVTRSLWGPLPVIPYMETGATDGLFLRNAGMPVYGFVGIFYDVDDVRSHGRDERIGVREFYDGLEFEYRLVKAVSSPSA